MNKKAVNSFNLYKGVVLGVSTVCFLIFALFTIKWAWCSDDAYHAYSMSKNLIHGNGFTPTIGKRVNVSTCPMWTLITTLVMIVFKDEYYVGMALNFFFSWGSFIILAYVVVKYYADSNLRKTIYGTMLLFVLTMFLCSSKSFVSYTTSGLENSLLFFLSAVFVVCFFNMHEDNKYFDNRRIFVLAFIEGLIIFTRMDAGIIFLPLCIYSGLNFPCETWEERIVCTIRRILISVLGVLPFIIWELFSFIYYGCLVPNTALAKLNTGFPRYEYFERGIAYYVKTLNWDFIVVAIPVVFVVTSIIVLVLYSDIRSNTIIYGYLSVGILLYMLYIIYIGGDFMMGRHFTVIFWIAIFSFVYVIKDVTNCKDQTYKKTSVFIVEVGGQYLYSF